MISPRSPCSSSALQDAPRHQRIQNGTAPTVPSACYPSNLRWAPTCRKIPGNHKCVANAGLIAERPRQLLQWVVRGNRTGSKVRHSDKPEALNLLGCSQAVRVRLGRQRCDRNSSRGRQRTFESTKRGKVLQGDFQRIVGQVRHETLCVFYFSAGLLSGSR